MTVGRELLGVPFPEMIQRLGMGVAEAQLRLDMVSVKIAQLMAGYDEEAAKEAGAAADAGWKSDRYRVRLGPGTGQVFSLLELGFSPTFYQFVDTVIELKMSISVQSEAGASTSATSVTAVAGGFALPFAAGGALSVTSVSASFQSKYQYSAEGSSLMRTKLVPIPPPAVFEERVRALIATRPQT